MRNTFIRAIKDQLNYNNFMSWVVELRLAIEE